MNFDNQKIKNILISGNYITKADLDKADKNIINSDVSLVDYLLENGLLTKELLGSAISESEGVPYFDLRINIPVYEQVLKVPEDIAKEYRVVLIKEEGDKMYFSSDDIKKAKELFSKMHDIFPIENIVLSYSLTEDIDFVFDYFYKKPLKTRFSDIITTGKRVAQEIVGEIFKDALSYNSSDIHFEPQNKETIIRFRVDGVLQEAGRISKEYYN